MHISYTYSLLCVYLDSKLASFQRQLNLYGFRRYTEGNIPSAYWNSKFLRDQPQLVPEMKRNLARNEKNDNDKNGEKSGSDRPDKLIRSDSIVTAGTTNMNDETFDTYVTTPTTGNEHLTVSPRSDITMDEAYPNPYHPSYHHLNQQQAQYRGKTVIPLDAWQNEQTFSLSDPQGLLSSEEINVQKKDKNTNRKRRKNNNTTTHNNNTNTPTANNNTPTPNNKSSSTTVSELSEDGDETVASSTMSPHMFSSRFTTSDLSRPNHTGGSGGYYNSTNYSATYINGIVSPPSPTTLSVMKGSSIGSGGGGDLNLMSVAPVDYHTGDHMSVPPSTAPKLYSLENINGVDCFVPVTLNSSTHSIAPILSRSGSVSSMASHHVSTPSYHDHKLSVPPSPGGANSCPCCAVNPHNAMQAVNHLIPHFAVTYNPPCAYVNGVDPLNSSCHSVMSNFSNHGAIPLPPPAMMHKPAPGLSPLMTDLSVNSLNAGMNSFQLDNPTRSPHHHPHVITPHSNPHAPLSPRVGRSLPNTPSLSRHQSAQSFFNGPYPLAAPLVSAPSSPNMSYNTKRKRNQGRNTNTTSALFSRQQSYNSFNNVNTDFDAIEFYNKSMQEKEAKENRIMTGESYTGGINNNTTTNTQHNNINTSNTNNTTTHTTIVSNSGNTSSGELSSELLEGGLILGDDAEFIKMFSDPNSEHYIPISTL